MAGPRYTETELWERIRGFWAPDRCYFSLVHENKYIAVDLDETGRRCRLQYESGRRKWIKFDDLYAIYRELYRAGRLSRGYLRDPENSLRVVGRKSWHAPGAAMYALLPLLDNRIDVSYGGDLLVRAQVR